MSITSSTKLLTFLFLAFFASPSSAWTGFCNGNQVVRTGDTASVITAAIESCTGRISASFSATELEYLSAIADQQPTNRGRGFNIQALCGSARTACKYAEISARTTVVSSRDNNEPAYLGEWENSQAFFQSVTSAGFMPYFCGTCRVVPGTELLRQIQAGLYALQPSTVAYPAQRAESTVAITGRG